MKNFIIFLIFINNLFSLEKYKEENILSIWNVEEKKLKLVEHRKLKGLEQLNNLKFHDELWKIISVFYPEDVINRIDKFVVFSDNNKNNRNGMSGLIESVDGTNNSRFILSVDIADAYYGNKISLEVFLNLLVHEFFHLVSLNDTQISPNYTKGVKIYEGYTYENSYINSFYEKFWNNSLGKKLEMLELNSKLSFAQKETIREELYKYNQDKFVDTYAMTNMVEDIAVSFEDFIRLNKGYLGDSLKDKKIDFFYSYADLVKYKNHFIQKKKEMIRKY